MLSCYRILFIILLCHSFSATILNTVSTNIIIKRVSQSSLNIVSTVLQYYFYFLYKFHIIFYRYPKEQFFKLFNLVFNLCLRVSVNLLYSWKISVELILYSLRNFIYLENLKNDTINYFLCYWFINSYYVMSENCFIYLFVLPSSNNS